MPGEREADIEEALAFYSENRIRSLSIFFLNYFPDAPITAWAHEQGHMNREQYERIMVNELVGEQSYKGTILDEAKAEQSVRYAMTLRLLSFMPGSWVVWFFRKRLHRFFPTNRILYYLLSGLAELKTKGLRYLFIIFFLSFSKKKG